MRRRPTAITLFTALTLLAPLVAGLVLLLRVTEVSPLESAAPPEPVVGVVESAQRLNETSVAVSLVPAETFSPRAHVDGLVTAVLVETGDTVTTGTVLLGVGDVDIVAYQADRPLHVDISAGGRGAVVSRAQQLLTDLGLYSGPVDGVAGSSTISAIVAFNTSHGSGRSRTLSLASLVWVGPAPITVANVEVEPGETISAGAPVLTAEAGLAGVAIDSGLVIDSSAPLVLDVYGVVVDLPPSATVVTDPQFTSAVTRMLAGRNEGTGVVRLRDPVTVATVPASAVVMDASGANCIFADVTGPPTAVTPTGGTLGTVDLAENMVGAPVLVNPREVRSDLSCE